MKTGVSLPPESPRVVVIVARDRPELYDYLVRGFSGVDDVEVIVDRRLPEPPGEVPQVPGEPGCQWTPDVYDELMLRGFVIRRLVDVSSRPGQAAPGPLGERLEGAGEECQCPIGAYAYRPGTRELQQEATGGPDGVKW